MVNTTGGPIKLEQGVFLSRALAFNGQVMAEPVELLPTCIGAVNYNYSPTSDKTTPNLSLDSHVKIVDYPDLKTSLMSLLNKYRDVIALPGEPLGATDKTEHHIKLKPNTHPVYTPA